MTDRIDNSDGTTEANASTRAESDNGNGEIPLGKATQVLATNRRVKFDPSLRTYFSPPDAHRIHDMIMNSADLQIATTREAMAIVAAGLWPELRALVGAISANASCGIAGEFEHYLDLGDEGREG
jgi:hypothetical protein